MSESNTANKVRTILVTSCKGGVGKSTCAANLAMSLAKRGKQTLLVDCDFDMRCLDLLLGVEDEVIYDLYDAAKGRIPVSKAMLRDSRCDKLCFLAAPFQGGNELTTDELQNMLISAASDEAFDYIILDTPGSLVSPAILGMGITSSAIIVASHQPSSIRAADKTGEYLSEWRVGEQRLLINSFDFDGAIKGSRPGINEIIDKTYIQLCGIVPYERELMILSENGRLAADSQEIKNCAAAFDNIACRIMGRYVPLFQGFGGIRTKRQIRRLLGRV
ncbi:MAG: septum site-determining protein MinD [Clostridiales bacterium]|nr:septum site-determining protein MinD [Clostridiales bacterium]